MSLPRRRPLYAADNEDTRSEIRALAPAAGHRVVCVAAGGGRALSLLGAGGGRFLAVDRRREQLHVLELAAASLDALRYEDLLRFLGVAPEPDRLDAWRALRGSLSPAARRYWDARPSLLRAGALYGGRLETWLARCARWLRRTGALAWPAACFAAPDLAAQRALLPHAGGHGERAWAALFHPALSWLAIQDPSFLRSTEGNPGRCLYRRFLAWAERHLLRESFLLHLIYFGRYDPRGALPLWLTREGSERARKGLARLELVCADLARLPGRLGAADAPVHWSLSDVSCWMGARRFQELLRAIAAGSPPGSRLCFRNLAARRALPPDPRLRRLPHLCDSLDRSDASVFYRFEVADVVEIDRGADRARPRSGRGASAVMRFPPRPTAPGRAS